MSCTQARRLEEIRGQGQKRRHQRAEHQRGVRKAGHAAADVVGARRQPQHPPGIEDGKRQLLSPAGRCRRLVGTHRELHLVVFDELDTVIGKTSVKQRLEPVALAERGRQDAPELVSDVDRNVDDHSLAADAQIGEVGQRRLARGGGELDRLAAARIAPGIVADDPPLVFVRHDPPYHVVGPGPGDRAQLLDISKEDRRIPPHGFRVELVDGRAQA
jgi:hypothetical protein